MESRSSPTGNAATNLGYVNRLTIKLFIYWQSGGNSIDSKEVRRLYCLQMLDSEKKYAAISELINKTKDRFINIAFPIVTDNRYDVIAVEKDGTCLFVKVIYAKAWRNHRSGNTMVDLPRQRQNQEGESKRYYFNNKTCDIIFISIPEGNYLVPSYEVTQQNAITIWKIEKYKI